MVAGPHAGHVRRHRLDDPSALVAEDHRQREREHAVERVEVRAADAAGGHPHQYLAGARIVDVISCTSSGAPTSA